ncbi:MAG: hypothetical protein QOJ62_1404, partial [Actinomycetota bacterium]|nr:hypothetical protein [Actinomycetota bacterium]
AINPLTGYGGLCQSVISALRYWHSHF